MAGVLAALGEVPVAGVVLLATVLWARGRARSLRPVAGTAVAGAGTALTVVALKAAIGRTAPGAVASDVLAGWSVVPVGARGHGGAVPAAGGVPGDDSPG